MNKLITTAVAGLLSTAAFPAEFQTINMQVMCSTTQEVVERQVKKYAEEPVYTANGVIKDKETPKIPGAVVFWINKETLAFSVTFTPDEYSDVTCYLTHGKNAKIYGDEL